MPSSYQASENKIWYDSNNHLLFFNGEVNEDNVLKFLHLFNKIEVDSKIKKYSLVISSGGGDLLIGLNVYSILSSSKKLKSTIAWSWVASSAIYLFLASSRRCCLPYTYFILHAGSWKGGEDKYNVPSLVAQLEFNKKLDSAGFNIITEKTAISRTELEKKLYPDSEWYFNSTEALNRKLVTEIVNGFTQ